MIGITLGLINLVLGLINLRVSYISFKVNEYRYSVIFAIASGFCLFVSLHTFLNL